jgi:hypothetical protein
VRALQASQLLQSCDEINVNPMPQGFKANPGLKLANAFSVKAISTTDSATQEAELSLEVLVSSLTGLVAAGELFGFR